jgi:hypothetical protein
MADDLQSVANLIGVPFDEAVAMGRRIGVRVRSLVIEAPCDCEDDLPFAPSGDVSALLREAEGYTEGGTP